MALVLTLRAELNVWLGSSLSAAAILGLSRFWWQPRLKRLGRINPRAVFAGLVLGGASVLATHAGFALLKPLAQVQLGVEHLYGTLDALPSLGIGCALVIFIASVEELLWRGISLDWLSRRFERSGPSVVLSALLYALPHAFAAEALLAGLAVGLGVFWAVLRTRFGSLSTSILAHCTWSIAIFFLWPLTG